MLAQMRLREAFILLAAEELSGAYSIAGYAAECAIKACIALQVRQYDFPDRSLANRVFTHRLGDLIAAGNLQPSLEAKEKADSTFQRNWALVSKWTENARYGIRSEREARDLYDALVDPDHGVMPWIQQHW